jgi:hypothetical protein
VNDVTLRTALVVSIEKGWTRKNLDVETAFLEGLLEEQIYMKPPPEYEEVLKELGTDEELKELGNDFEVIRKLLKSDSVLELKRCIYGLVQAARQWYKKIAEVLTKQKKGLGFIRSKKDPCLFTRKNSDGEIIICLYVDDCGMMGEKEAIISTSQALSKHFSVKVTSMDAYVGCSYIDTEGGLLLHQPRLLKRLRDKFGSVVSKLPVYNTPLATGYTS